MQESTNSTIQEQSALPTEQEYLELVQKVYTWGYPLILMNLTKKISTNTQKSVKASAFGKAPINQVARVCKFPNANFTSVVKPNVDTYYTTAWMDLSSGPLVLEVPSTNRYFLLPLFDAYSNVFKSPGTRTIDTSVSHIFYIAGPDDNSDLPEGMELIQAPTNMVWMLGRIQVNSFEDGVEVVYPIQDNIRLTPYQYYGQNYTPPKGAKNSVYDIANPVKYIEKMPLGIFFNQMANLMNENPPADYDREILKEMKIIGIEQIDGVYKSNFSVDNSPTGIRKQLRQIPFTMGNTWIESQGTETTYNGWLIQTGDKGNYQNNYTQRAYQAYTGLGANLPEDAIYPTLTTQTNSIPLNSECKYTLTFQPEDLPPVNQDAFWSLTAYNNKNYLVKNPLNRYALGSTSGLAQNEDGSITIYIQAGAPESDKLSNWLPITRHPYDASYEPSATNCYFSLTMRLYYPQEEALDLTWIPPRLRINLEEEAIKKVESTSKTEL